MARVLKSSVQKGWADLYGFARLAGPTLLCRPSTRGMAAYLLQRSFFIAAVRLLRYALPGHKVILSVRTATLLWLLARGLTLSLPAH